MRCWRSSGLRGAGVAGRQFGRWPASGWRWIWVKVDMAVELFRAGLCAVKGEVAAGKGRRVLVVRNWSSASDGAATVVEGMATGDGRTVCSPAAEGSGVDRREGWKMEARRRWGRARGWLVLGGCGDGGSGIDGGSAASSRASTGVERRAGWCEWSAVEREGVVGEVIGARSPELRSAQIKRGCGGSVHEREKQGRESTKFERERERESWEMSTRMSWELKRERRGEMVR